MEGVFKPEQIFFLTKNFGINLFDSSFTVWLTENGKGFQIGNEFPQKSYDYKIIDFNDQRLRYFNLNKKEFFLDILTILNRL